MVTVNPVQPSIIIHDNTAEPLHAIVTWARTNKAGRHGPTRSVRVNIGYHKLGRRWFAAHENRAIISQDVTIRDCEPYPTTAALFDALLLKWCEANPDYVGVR